MNLLNNHIYLIEYETHYYILFGNISEFKLLAFRKHFLISQILLFILESQVKNTSIWKYFSRYRHCLKYQF